MPRVPIRSIFASGQGVDPECPLRNPLIAVSSGFSCLGKRLTVPALPQIGWHRPTPTFHDSSLLGFSDRL